MDEEGVREKGVEGEREREGRERGEKKTAVDSREEQ